MFQDRKDAGQQLAQKLKAYESTNPLVLALPRGGVPVGYEVALFLHAPLDVFVVRKIGAPWNPEFGVGAVAPGICIFDENSLHMLDLKKSDLDLIIKQEEEEEVRRRLHLYRQDESFPNLEGRTAILVDDGVATGITTRAAIQALKAMNPLQIILALPVGAPAAIHDLEKSVDKLICLELPPFFHAVSAFYQRFPQVSDEEVIYLLQHAKEKLKTSPPKK
jgi:putative phosphoribosyl transferase